MKKVANIAWKDLTLTFRDPAALALMLVTPFALTLVIAFAFGRFSDDGGGGSGGLADIPVVIVNHDPGQFGEALVQVFESDELAHLLEPAIMGDDAAARATVDADETAAAVIIPADLSESVLFIGSAQDREQSVIEVYVNSTRPISAGVARSIVDQFLSRVAAGSAGGQVAVVQLVVHDLIPVEQAAELGQEIGQRAGEQAANTQLIAINSKASAENGDTGFDWMGYMAPGLAILFLMFTVTAGGRSILAERDEGTLPRMLVSPTSVAQVLGGKISGIYLTGLVQMFILIAASGLLFSVRWGSPLAVVLLTLALVAAATGWGLVIAAFARTPGQANAVGTAIALIFGIGAGSFFPRQSLPQWLQTASLISPNAWGLEGFGELAAGGSLAGVLLPIAALLGMAVVLFVVAATAFRRQY